MLLQICQRPLDRVAGKIEIFGYRFDTGPAASRAIGPVFEVHIAYATERNQLDRRN